MIEKKGLYTSVEDGQNRLIFGDGVIDSVPSWIDKPLGLYVNGKKLNISGIGIAESELPAAVIPVDDGVYLNEVNLLPQSGECVNITLEDYSTLFGGGLVAGYKRYSESTIYNIVADVASAPTVTYTVSGGTITFSGGATAEIGKDMVYNNVNGLAENTIDNTATMANTNPPFACLRWFEPVIPVGGTIELSYHVDSQTMPSTNYGTIEKTFTVIVRTAAGQVVKKTTYAGDFKITTPAFSTAGETWFSVEVIDSDGVGSPVQYFDILVRNAVVANHYEMRQSDLETFGIKVGECAQVEAYKNKAALTALFAWAKKEGYNGIKMINAVYYIDYHKNISDVDGEIDFGSQTYYKVTVSNKKITDVEGSNEQEAAADSQRTIGVSREPAVGDSCDSDDGQRFLVFNTAESGDDIVFPDGFTIDLNDATIKATQCVDLYVGSMVTMQGCFDTHIINGKLVGNYKNFDFVTSQLKTGVRYAGEGLGVSGLSKSRYCSFENVDISYATGYEAGAGGNVYDWISPTLTQNSTVDLSTGAVVSNDGMQTSNLIDISGRTEIIFSKDGYAGYGSATKREIFFSFYDAQQSYLSSVKSKLYHLCKVPSGAHYVRISGYGISGFTLYRPDFSKNVGYSDCYWHNTKSCASAPTKVKGFSLIDCTYKDIATRTDYHGVTSVLGDMEDGHQYTNHVTIQGCSCIGKTQPSADVYIIHHCNGLDWHDNTGISLYYYGGVEYGYVEGSSFPELSIPLSKAVPRPFVMYCGNTIGSLEVTYNQDPGVGVEVIPVITMSDTVIKSHCTYNGLKLKNSTNGSEKVL